MLRHARNELDNYHLYNVVKPLLTFLEQLTNWYVRLNRSRMKGDEGVKEQQVSLNILFDALLSTNLLMASITPFITEEMYQNMRNGIAADNLDLNQESIHFLQIPDVALDLIHEDVELRFKRM
jgi:isoleucyl-tRNA synthetase